MIRQKLLQLGWEVLIFHHIHHILHLMLSIYFGPYKILLLDKISIPWNTVKGTCNSSLLKKIKKKKKKTWGKWNYEVVWKMAEGSGTKWWMPSSIKFLAKLKKKSLLFLHIKPKDLLANPIHTYTHTHTNTHMQLATYIPTFKLQIFKDRKVHSHVWFT